MNLPQSLLNFIGAIARQFHKPQRNTWGFVSIQGDQMDASMEMPRYRCHKQVWALKIKTVEPDGSAPRGAEASCIITPVDGHYAPLRVDEQYCRKHNPQAGGYYVVYDDGYKSYSPAKAFEEGYTRV